MAWAMSVRVQPRRILRWVWARWMRRSEVKIIERRESGRPSCVELTEVEEVISEIYALLLDQGHGMLEAMIALRGAEVPGGLRSPTPYLDAALTPEFVDWLTG